MYAIPAWQVFGNVLGQHLEERWLEQTKLRVVKLVFPDLLQFQEVEEFDAEMHFYGSEGRFPVSPHLLLLCEVFQLEVE